MNKFNKILPGVMLAAGIGIIAYVLGIQFPVLGGAVIAIILGILIKNIVGVKPFFNQGISYTLKTLLKLAIVLLGFGFSVNALWSSGLSAVIIVLVAVTIGFGLTFLLTKLFGLSGNIPLLIGAGTAICGATAIATTGPVLKAKEEDITYAINTIFFFNVLAVFLYPTFGHFLGMSDYHFGVWAGTSIHDTSSVVAAGYLYSNEAGDTSVIVKLIRTLMLVPLVLLFSLYVAFKHNKENKNGNNNTFQTVVKSFPTFIIFFLIAVAINSIFNLNTNLTNALSTVAKFLIVMVMASVGLGTVLKKIKVVGLKPLLIGLASSIIMEITTLLLTLYLV